MMMRDLVISIALLTVFHPMFVTCSCLNNGLQELTLNEGDKKGTNWAFSEKVKPEYSFDKFKDLFELVDEKSLRLKKDFNLDGDENKALCKHASDGILFKVKCTNQETAQVFFTVAFTDDKAPSFDKEEYVANVEEGRPKGIQVLSLKIGENVTDEDCGQNDYTPYIESSIGSDNFEVKKTTSHIQVFTTSTLDYEQQTEYRLNISVRSKFSTSDIMKTAYATLVVQVDDVDDRDPVFTSPTYLLTVSEEENLTDTWLASSPAIHAYDGDTGINTPIVYIIDKTEPALDVEINPTDGRIRIKSILDRETTSSYSLDIKAEQRDTTYKNTKAQLTLQVRDVNDHLPTFSSLGSNVNLKENAQTGKWILPLEVKDDDIGDNAINTISIFSDDLSAFELRQPNGDGVNWLVIKDGTKLFGKTTGLIEIHATPTTKLFGDLSCDYKTTCVTKISVTILDYNDHRPTFGESAYEFSVFQPKQGQSVGSITASDEDTGDNAKLTFSVASVTSDIQFCKDGFNLNTGSGEITIKNEVTQTELCLLNVQACDNPSNGDEQLCTVVPINIKLNHIAPTKTIDLDENKPIGTLLFKLPINDLKIDNQDFKIDGNRLVTNQLLDREITPEYTLNLTKDGTTVSTITVHVKDVNDNAPVPERPVYVIPLTGREHDGTVIATVKATDKDEGQNAVLSYSLINHKDWLGVDEITGQVSLTKMPDNKDGNIFQVFVIIRDKGNPPRSSGAELKISFPTVNEAKINVTPLILPCTRNFVVNNTRDIEKKLSSIIGNGITITVVDVRSLSEEVQELGSELMLTAVSLDGKNISSIILERLLKEKAREIYDVFRKNPIAATTEPFLVFDSTLPPTTTTPAPRETDSPIHHDFFCDITHMSIHIPISLLPNSKLTLKDPVCVLKKVGTNYVLDFKFDECGSSVAYFTDVVYISNEINVHKDLGSFNSPIVLDTDFKIPLKCSLNRTALIEGGFQTVTREPIIEIEDNSDKNKYVLYTLREFKTAAYKEEITDYPVQIPINREIFMELSVNESKAGFGIEIERCYATPTADPKDSTSYTLLAKGCPASAVVHMIPSSTTRRRRFKVQAFHFGGAKNDHDKVYIHCQVHYCTQCETDDECSNRRKRSLGRLSSSFNKPRYTRRARGNERNIAVSLGPIEVL